MMEGMNQEVREEYIWAMRSSAFKDSDNDSWKDRRPTRLESRLRLQSRRQNRSSKCILPYTEEQHTKVMASLVPDEVIYNVNNYNIKRYNAAFLFGDVSGFTDLCEKYNRTGKGGPSRMTQLLNTYIGSMVQEVMSHNGDVLKFSGDAFLAMFKNTQNESMPDCVHEAVDCALMIQKSHGTYETDVGILLKVKLAISAGHVIFSLIGNQKFSNYVVIGQPISDAKVAEHISSAGEIIVSPTAWHYVNSNEYLHEFMSDKYHIKVLGVGKSWRSTHFHTRYKIEYRRFSPYEQDDEDSAALSYGLDSDTVSKLTAEEFSLRPAVNAAAKMNIKESLKKFIIPPVMRGIDLDEPLEYLTEMRQVVILFINIVTYKIAYTSFVSLVNIAYNSICKIVDEFQGCVNKVSLFDKDLMFVVIFGLRGFKHELESQIGLKCASECYASISQIDGVSSTSIGVTTGLTYCGVVGHTLRREYTVIGLIVNKAARLMVAYPNKVTCDRETFLHSKMEGTHFTLQEYRELKGIHNPGPIYEFKEMAIGHGEAYKMSPFPLLGRKDEVKLFKRLLHDFMNIATQKSQKTGYINSNYFSALLIHGVPRQGKTRLLNELIFCAPKGIKVNRFSLSMRDSLSPYMTIRLIFSASLGLDESNTSSDWEKKLQNCIKVMKLPELMCVFNSVFNVKFERTPLFMALNEAQKTTVLEKMLKQLLKCCYTSIWIIAIDDVEYIDDESWELLKIIIEIDLVFLIMTIGERKTLNNVAKRILSHPRIRTFNLQSIDKYYHAGLACQILDVRAIPPELEKNIQTRSNGNPGWIESFLISLIQAGGLYIKYLELGEVYELGFVIPPVDMMIRINEKHLEKIDKESVKSLKLDQEKTDNWNMYQQSYKDSTLNLITIQKKFLQGKDFVPICAITPNFNFDDMESEISMDAMMLKTFDSLTSYEQHLLKCSSTLGEYFLRDMLDYLMDNNSPRNTALAVQKLFEIHVLGCAKGDFTQGDVCIVFRERLINPNFDKGIKCACRGISIHDSCKDLPKYASCGYLRFRLPMFQETTYNLLTDKQRRELHTRAIRYLERETRRCRSCGNGFFVRILGTKIDDGLREGKRRSRYSLFADIDYSRHSTIAGVINDRNRSTTKRDTLILVNKSFHQKGATYYKQPGCFGIVDIQRLKRKNSLTKTFSYADFANCQCSLILNTMYTKMLYHCIGAGSTEKMLEVMLEFSYVCIMSYNIPQAMKVLKQASNVIESQICEEDEVSKWKIPLQRGKVMTLLGKCYLELGQLNDAYNVLTDAMRSYGNPFPTSAVSIRIKTFYKEIRQTLSLCIAPKILIATANSYEADFCDNLSECLSLLCTLFMETENWKNAELAAVWSLNKALESEMDFYSLCSAFTNMLEVMMHLGKQWMCIALEVHALTLCHKKQATIEVQELAAVGKLYAAIFYGRLMRSEIERAISMGYVITRISYTIHAVFLNLRILPFLVQALLIRQKIVEAVSMLQEMEHYSEEDSDNSGRTWYYALCVCLLLETGYTLVPFRICEKYYQVEGETMITTRDPDAEKRYYTVMWLWCIRKGEWEAATVWYTKARNFIIVQEDDNMANVFTGLYLLEGLLLYLVGKIDKHNIRAVTHAYHEINCLIKILEKAIKKFKITQPRFIHLRAYFKFIRDNDNGAFQLLNQAKNMAEKNGNLLEISWVEHSEKAWLKNLASVLVDFWKEHCDHDNLMDYHEVELNGGRLGLFTLPVPMYS